jgi:hypothetical protein
MTGPQTLGGTGSAVEAAGMAGIKQLGLLAVHALP